mmetsp:Transcript_11544/g.20497  ORF Transcript_11544/g.20497 Transcript_11544/m.20497 type:complete len:871 (+) Transcript_11544:310-2922(+)
MNTVLAMEPVRAIRGFEVTQVKSPFELKPKPLGAGGGILQDKASNESQSSTMHLQVSTILTDAPPLPPRTPPPPSPSAPLLSHSAGLPALFLRPATKRQAPAHTPPGWEGLLQISRMSGASGVVGQPPRSDEDPTIKDSKIEICCTARASLSQRAVVKGVIRGLKACQEPERTKEGMGGTYIMCNEKGRQVAIFKPCDEEPLACNNPKGYVGRALGEPGWKPTVRVGEAAMREVAAYLLDHGRRARVPTTVLVRARHPKFCYNNRMSSVRQSSIDLSSEAGLAAAVEDGSLPMKLGSLQEFVSHQCDTSEMGPSRFSVRDVHRIGILDIRLVNTDRHAGNLLVRAIRPADLTSTVDVLKMGSSHNPMLSSQYELIPIDHGFCLPETLEACYFEWLHWPQAMLPFSEEDLAYIESLNVEDDVALLHAELPTLRPACILVMQMATELLKRGAAAGLTLHDIGCVLTRGYECGNEEPSELERVAAIARRAMLQHAANSKSNQTCRGIASADDELTSEEGDATISEGDEDEGGSGSECGSYYSEDEGDVAPLLESTPSALRSSTRSVAPLGVSAPSSSGLLRANSSLLHNNSTLVHGLSFTHLNGGLANAISLAQGVTHISMVLPDSLRASGSGPLMSIILPTRFAPGSREDVGMVFDMDEALAAAAGPLTPTHQAYSPGTASSISSAISSMEQFSFVHAGFAAAAGNQWADMVDTPPPIKGSLGGGTASMGCLGSSGGSSAVGATTTTQMASSVHVTDPSALMARHAQRRNAPGLSAGGACPGSAGASSHNLHPNHHRHRSGHRKLRRLGSNKLFKDDPMNPDPLNCLFTMEDDEWAEYMQVWGYYVDVALQNGHWKQGLKRDATVAASCPRF